MYYPPWPIVNFCYSALETLDFEVNPCHNTYMKNNQTNPSLLNSTERLDLQNKLYDARKKYAQALQLVEAKKYEIALLNQFLHILDDTPLFDEMFGG